MNESSWVRVIHEVGPEFAERASRHDADDSFVAENFAVLRQKKIFSAMVPADLGGGGASYAEMVAALRALARYCSSTALTLSMHQHLIGFQRYNHEHGKPGRAVLEKVASKQLQLVSTGARDFLASSGAAEKVEGGFKVTARKSFASGSAAGDVVVTSAAYRDAEKGWQVLHFSVPLDSPGVRVESDWKAMGMRGTGSNTVVLDKVFVADDAVGLRRTRGVYHPAWSIIFGQALPLISAVYVGVAEAACEIVKSHGPRRKTDSLFHLQLGEVVNEMNTASIALDSMVSLVNNFDFPATPEFASEILSRKTIATRAALNCATRALEAVGGAGYYRSLGLERLVRDAFAGQFHPLPDRRQQLFTGRVAVGLEPPDEPFDVSE